MVLQLGMLRRRFPSRFDKQGRPHDDLPLFPNSQGQVCSKDSVVDTIRMAALSLGLAEFGPDGCQSWTGHTLRITRAQRLAAAGLVTWAIQLLGRWGSDVVLGYLQSAPLTGSASEHGRSHLTCHWATSQSLYAAQSRKHPLWISPGVILGNRL